MAGHSGTPLERKLGVRPDHVVYLDGAPETFDLDAPTTRRLPRHLDISLTFNTSAAPEEPGSGVAVALLVVAQLAGARPAVHRPVPAQIR